MGSIRNNFRLKTKRSNLRNGATAEEITLWNCLKGSKLEGYKFRRQTSIGPYIVDFYCHELKLIIELDGAVHKKTKEHDRVRDLFLKNNGYTVIRFWNGHIQERLGNVLKKIVDVIWFLETSKTTPACGHPSWEEGKRLR